MKNNFALLITLTLVLGNASTAAAQQDTADLKAVGRNGAVALKIKNSNVLDTRFYSDTADTSDYTLDLYFDMENPKNATYAGRKDSVSPTEIYVVFDSLSYISDDSLTFSVIERMVDSTLQEYVFVRGENKPVSDRGISVCPTEIACVGISRFYLVFDPLYYQVSLTGLMPITIFKPDAFANGTFAPIDIDLEANAFVISSRLYKWTLEDCQALLSGTVVIQIGGHTCIFQDGRLVNSPCSPWSDYYQNFPGCADIFENCNAYNGDVDPL